MIDRLLVYVAGPYTHPDPVMNTTRAIKVADELVELGYSVWIPHLSMLWHMICPHPPEFWYNHDYCLLRRCDLVYRLKGTSWGADEEVRLAIEWGIPVFYERDEL